MGDDKKQNAAERMLKTKRALIKRLRQDKARVLDDAASVVDKIEGRIRVAQTLVEALEKGTLKV